LTVFAYLLADEGATDFTHLASIKIGGRTDINNRRIINPFYGIISGMLAVTVIAVCVNNALAPLQCGGQCGGQT